MRGKHTDRIIEFRGTSDAKTSDAKSISEENEVVAINHIISNNRINCDDTIAQIKSKIITELNYEGLVPNSIYLCADVNHQINTTNINLSAGEIAFHQLLVNLEIEYEIPNKIKTYELQDILVAGIKHGETRQIPIGLGMTITPFDYVFPANPMYIIPGMDISKYIKSITYSNNSILMTAGDIVDNTIFVYFAEDVLEYARQNQIPETDIINIYFPEYREAPINIVKPSIVEFLYDLYYSAKEPQKYTERGIHQYDITLFSENLALFSLDAIFKNIHCSSEIPFIRYKPGIRRDPIYRLYSTSATKSGKRIPVLSYKRLTSLVNSSANYKHISVHNEPYNVSINIENDGTIRIVGKIMRTIDDNKEKDKKLVPATASIADIDELLKKAVNPFLIKLNQYLTKSGYKVPFFTSIMSPSIKVNNLSYSTSFIMKSSLNLNNGCTYSIFDVANTTDEKMVLRFKRVDNFKKMDAQSALISEVYKKSGSEAEVIEALMNNYNMSNRDAILRFIEYQENLNYMRGPHSNRAIERTNMFESIKNPGFLTNIEEHTKGPEKKEIKITVSNLTNIRYIDTIGIYIDSLIFLSQTNDVELQQKCNAISYVEDAGIEDANGLPDAGIEVAGIEVAGLPVAGLPVAGLPVAGLPKAQPVDINKLISRFENKEEAQYNDELKEDELSENEEDFLESDDDEESKTDLVESDFLESDDEDSLTGGGYLEGGYLEGGYLEGGYLEGGDPEDDLKDIEDEEGEEGEGEEEAEEAEARESKYNTTSKAKKMFIRKLKEHDPKLFSFTQTKSGQFKHYTRVCQSMLQPVILTQEEKENVDANYKGSYTKAVEYGSSPDKKNWYICPRFWCFKTNTSMSKEDIDAGKCGTTKAEIKKNVFEFNAPKEHMNAAGKYVDHFPGFKKDIHPNGYCLPCCFSEWDTQLHKDRRAQCMGNAPVELADGRKPDQMYIIGADKIPVDPGRWGFAQYAVQYFLQIDYRNHISKTNTTTIRDKTETILRYGIKQEAFIQEDGNVIPLRNRSIVASFADIYARVYKIKTPSVPDFLKIVVDAISIDEFVQYGNGTYMTIFADDNQNCDNPDNFIAVDDYLTESSVYRFLDMTNLTHYKFFCKLRSAYERFLAFLQDPSSTIDHTYFWDIIATPNPRLFRDGLNLVLMEITNNDVTENIDIICPTNAYSANQFKLERESVFMIKSNDLYLPLYKYTLNGKEDPTVVPLFNDRDFPAIYKIMNTTIGNYCKPQASITGKYIQPKPDDSPNSKNISFKQPMPIMKLVAEIAKTPYTIEQQIWNYQGKIISLLLRSKTTGNTVIVPCQPTAPIPHTIPATFMDDISILNNYATTKSELVKLGAINPNILCQPIVKIFESGLIVGIITETNQVIRIKSPEPDVADSLVPLGEENYILYREMAKKVETVDKGDEERIRVVRNVELEANFYALFRTTLKSVLESAPVSLMRIAEAVKSADITLDKMTTIVRDIMEPAVVFAEGNTPNKTLDDKILDDMYQRAQICRDKHVSMITKDKKCIFPKQNLVDALRDNSYEYYVRIADELLRYGNLRNFILKPQSILNVGNETYVVNENEYIVVEAELTDKDYFADMVSFNKSSYINGIPFEMASPDPKIARKYQNEVSLEEQMAAGSELLEVVNRCKSNIKDVYGHPATNYWRRWVFPRDKTRKIKEIYFKNTHACSFGALIYILQDHFKELYSENQVREMIWEGYSKLMSAGLLDKLYIIFEIQGKRNLVERIKSGKNRLDEIVLRSPDYFVTMMDIWVVAHTYNVPVIAFSSLKELSGMGITALDNPMKTADESSNAWIVMGGSSEHRQFYFVRSPTVVYNYKVDVITEIQVIFGPLATTEMDKLESKLQSALLRLEYVQRIQGPEYFLLRVRRLEKNK